VPFFTIIIPTLNEAEYLPGLLDDLSRQSWRDFTVIVVDGRSDDQTVARAEAFQDRLDLIVLPSAQRHVSVQRNLGAEQAQSEWLLFLDADTRLPHYFMHGLSYQLLKQPNTDVFTSWAVPDSKSAFNAAITKLVNLTVELYQSIGHKVIGKAVTFGACLGCRKKVFKKLKFDPKKRVSEDADFVSRAMDMSYSYRVFRDPQYVLSLRRLRREGTLAVTGKVALLQLQHLQGGDFDNRSFGYDMNGGQYYSQPRTPVTVQVHQFLSKASDRQLERARHVLRLISEVAEWPKIEEKEGK